MVAAVFDEFECKVVNEDKVANEDNEVDVENEVEQRNDEAKSAAEDVLVEDARNVIRQLDRQPQACKAGKIQRTGLAPATKVTFWCFDARPTGKLS